MSNLQIIQQPQANLLIQQGVKGDKGDSGADAIGLGVAKSIVNNAGNAELSGDSVSPGNNKVYGTNASGVKGWKDDPAGGGGGRVLLQTQTISSAVASVVFTSGINSTYKKYEVDLIDITPSTDDVGLLMRTSSNGGTSYDSGASDYSTAGQQWWSASTGGIGISVNNSSAVILSSIGGTIGISNVTSENALSGLFTLFDPSNTTRYKAFMSQVTFSLAAANFNGLCLASGQRKATSAVNAIQFIMSSGNIASGTFKLFGVP